MQDTKTTLFRQRLFRIHIACGVIFSLIMYISIFFGVFAIFLPQIKSWEKPSKYVNKVDITKINYNFMVEKVVNIDDFPKDDFVINLTGRIDERAVSIQNRFTKPITFNPNTNEIIENEDKDITNLAEFLNELHYGQPLKLIGRLIFGFTAVGTLVLVVTGLMLIYIFKYHYRAKNQQALYSTIHVKTFTWLFLPFLLIVLSGAVMNVGLISAPPMSKMLTKGEAKSIDALVGSTLFYQTKAEKKENIGVNMLQINELLIKAKEINPELTFKQIRVLNWGDKTARAEFNGYNPYKPFLNGGIFNIPFVSFNLHTGELLQDKRVLDTTYPVLVAEAIFFLHFLFGIDIFSRTIIALMMMVCAVSIGFSILLFLEKQAKKFQNKENFYHYLGRFSLATMIGVIPATATLFVLQWILPFDLEDRVLWQQGAFYNVWLFTLFWSFYKLNSYKAAKEFFFVGGLLFILSAILHILKFDVDISFIKGVNYSLIAFGVLLIFIAVKIPNNQNSFILSKFLKDKK